ncbi:MAG: 4Fe-4S dicluster domain-containing protein, partial [Syntrophobacteraceae bacterium]
MIELRVGEFAEKLGVHRNTVRNWIKNGALRASSFVAKKYFVEEEEFLRFCRFQGIPGSIASQFLGKDFQPLVKEEKMMDQQSASVSEPRSLGTRESILRADPQWADVCLTCGSCASACPISGVDGMDPRKIVRMIVLGRSREVIESNWPWKCTLCGKCEEACPMNVELMKLFRRIRWLRDRDKVPGPLHKGVMMALRRGNNLGIPKSEFVGLLEEVGEELAEEGCPGFKTPIDVEGANLLITVNSKEPFGEPDDMKFWWKIFHAAGESWTISSENWEGVNWGLFTGDDDSMRIMVGRIVDNML